MASVRGADGPLDDAFWEDTLALLVRKRMLFARLEQKKGKGVRARETHTTNKATRAGHVGKRIGQRP